MNADLKPCPFCGETNVIFREGSTFRWWLAECGECGATSSEVRRQSAGDGANEEWDAAARVDALREWNTRADAAEVEAMRAAWSELRNEIVESIGGYTPTNPWEDGFAFADRQTLDSMDRIAAKVPGLAASDAPKDADA